MQCQLNFYQTKFICIDKSIDKNYFKLLQLPINTTHITVKQFKSNERCRLSIESESGNSEPWVLNNAQSVTNTRFSLPFTQLFLFCTQLKSFTFVFIRFTSAYAQLRDFGYRNRGIEAFKILCAIVYGVSFILNVFLA